MVVPLVHALSWVLICNTLEQLRPILAMLWLCVSVLESNCHSVSVPTNEHSTSALQQGRRGLPSSERSITALERSLSCLSLQVIVVSGETGCGKTTQVPQFILEESIAAGAGSCTSIVCTQPRRISAVSIAQRVATERGETVGRTVGYSIRLESKASEATRLLFCTTGRRLPLCLAGGSAPCSAHGRLCSAHGRVCSLNAIPNSWHSCDFHGSQ